MQHRLPIADHEPRSAVVSASPRLGVPVLGLVADARHLADDLTPSLDADARPTRAFEYGEELAVRVSAEKSIQRIWYVRFRCGPSRSPPAVRIDHDPYKAVSRSLAFAAACGFRLEAVRHLAIRLSHSEQGQASRR